MSAREHHAKRRTQPDIPAPERRIRVLQVAATSTGGVGLVLLYLVRHLDPNRFDVSVAFGRGYLLDEQFDRDGIPIIELPTGRGANPFSVLQAVFRLYRILRAGHYDVVHGHTSVGGLVARVAGFAAGVPCCVWTVHAYGSRPGLGPVTGRAILALERALDYLTDRYVAVSEDMKRVGLRKRIFVEEKVTVIHNGIDLQDLDRIAASCDARKMRETLQIPADAIVVGTVTRLEPQKAIDDFLQAAALISGERRDVYFVIAGDGPLRVQLLALSNQLGIADRVLFLGWRSDPFAVLNSFDVYCMSSLWEGCPMVLLEAMVASKPVVSTRVGGVGEVVVDGQTGLLVPSGKPERLATVLQQLIGSTQLRRRYGAAGRQRVERYFTLEKMMHAHEQFYDDLVGSRR